MKYKSPIILIVFMSGGLIQGHRQQESLTPDVKYYLYTRDNINKADYIFLSSNNIGILKHNRKVVLFIDGWTSSRETSNWYEPLKNTLLAKEDVSIIQVDYNPIESLPYIIAAKLVQPVGDDIGALLKKIYKKVGIKWRDFHLIGHSLGGQISGFVGKRIHEDTKDKIGKITALDPAGPLFNDPFRLTKNDAIIVEVVHTDGNKLGYFGRSGSVDFYPNGGTAIQPGCPGFKTETKDVLLGNYHSVACSHARSYEYYMESQMTGGFTATECSSYENFQKGKCHHNKKLKLGGKITEHDEGTYYLQTNSKRPYSID